jgi:hypothetical protein
LNWKKEALEITVYSTHGGQWNTVHKNKIIRSVPDQRGMLRQDVEALWDRSAAGTPKSRDKDVQIVAADWEHKLSWENHQTIVYAGDLVIYYFFTFIPGMKDTG